MYSVDSAPEDIYCKINVRRFKVKFRTIILLIVHFTIRFF